MMTEPTIRTTRTHFEYYGEQIGFDWAWYFRPVGAPLFVQAPGAKKADVLELLDKPASAVAQYERGLARMTDVEAAKAELARAEAFHEKVKAPDWDPGGNTNNPDKVARALKEAADSGAAVERAKQKVDIVTRTATRVSSTPFDGAAWLAKHHAGT